MKIEKMNFQKMLVLLFAALFGLAFLAIASVHLFSAFSTYEKANMQLSDWESIMMDVSEVNHYGKGTYITNSYFYKNEEIGTENIRCSCSSKEDYCAVGRSVEILVDPDDPETAVLKQCAIEDAEIGNLYNIIIILAAVGLFAALIIFSTFAKTNKSL